MGKARRKFDREYKLRAVELSYEMENIKQLGFELGIRPELIYLWRSELAAKPAISFPANWPVYPIHYTGFNG